MTITPDTKDWTWVLERPCPECGFDTAAVTTASLPRLIRDNGAHWDAYLSGGFASSGLSLQDRPSPDRWSGLEYACHVRDVFVLFDRRLRLMLAEADPIFANWDQDATAVAERYNQQHPVRVRTELMAAGAQLADDFETLSGPAWDRTGTRSDGARFTVASFARYLIHDPVHHLHDVGWIPSAQPRADADAGAGAGA